MNIPSKFNPKQFEVFDPEDNVRVVSLAFDIVLYTDHDLSKIADGVLHAYDRFLALCPPEKLRWYTTENMTSHKRCTPRALNMLRSWLKPGAPKREIINIEIRDGEVYYSTSDFAFWIYGEEEGYVSHGYYPNMVRLCFPREWGYQKTSEMFALAKDLCDHFPFQSGHSGYVLQTTRYYQEKSETSAWQLSIRHRGLDIQNEVGDRIALLRDGIKGVNWLTMLCNAFIERIGGYDQLRKSLPEAVELISVKDGLILKAGPAPVIGDVNRKDFLPAYKAVYRVVTPLQEPTIERYGSFDLPGEDYVEKTEAWLRRFADD